MSTDEKDAPPVAAEEGEKKEDSKTSDPVTPANLEASKQAEAEKEKWKKDNALPDRMAKLASAAAGGTATGMGLAGIGAQIAAKVKETKEGGDGKLSVQKVAKDL